MYQVTLPWPPTVNTFYSVNKGRKLISKKGRAYKKEAGYFLKAKGLTGPIAVEIACNPPDKRKRDLDNILKPLLDVMTENGVYEDDSQINYLLIYKCSEVEKGTVEIKVRENENI